MDRQDHRTSNEDIVSDKPAKAEPRPPRMVRIVPVPGAFIQGVPAVEQEVDPERAKELLAYTPPAFKKA